MIEYEAVNVRWSSGRFYTNAFKNKDISIFKRQNEARANVRVNFSLLQTTYLDRNKDSAQSLLELCGTIYFNIRYLIKIY